MLIKAQKAEIEVEEWREILLQTLDDETSEEDINMLVDSFYELINNPVSINRADRKELERIPFLSDRLVENILYYRDMYGEIFSLAELQAIEGMDYYTIRLVRPFFVVEPPLKEKQKVVENLFKNPRHTLTIRYEPMLNEKYGYVDKSDSVLTANPNLKYRGGSTYGAVRYRISGRDYWDAGIAAEKDAGERGVDYLNGYVRVKNAGVVNNLILGSYKAHLGLGLVFNNGFSLGKSAVTLPTLTRTAGFSPHASTDEWNYLRGAAVQLRRGDWFLLAAGSYRTLDGTLSGDTLLSFKKDGLHRLPRDIEKRRAVGLGSGLLSVRRSLRQGYVAVNSAVHLFDKAWVPTARIYNRDAFRGRKMLSLSVDYLLRLARVTLRGEEAVAESGAVALLNIATFKPYRSNSFTLIHRYYGSRYHGFMNKSFSETTGIAGEHGVALLASLYPMPRLSLSGTVDIFKLTTPLASAAVPSSGYELRLQTTYQPTDKLDLIASYRLKNKYKTTSEAGDTLPVLTSYQQHRAELRLNALLSETFYLRSSAGCSFYRLGGGDVSRGVILSQSAGYRPGSGPLQVDLQTTLFDTDDTYASVLLSEKSVLYSSGFSTLSGEGMRWSLNVRYDASRHLSISLKAAQTRYFDRETIGSGLELINSSVRSTLTAQLRLKF